MVTQTLLKNIADLLPLTCEICHFPLERQTPPSWYCLHCAVYFEPTLRCQQCGLPMLTKDETCGACLASPPPWHRLYCVGDYQPPLSQIVHKFKYERQFWHSSKLVHLLSQRVDRLPEVITCVPLHWQRYWWRGFNQSELLAVDLAKSLGIEFQPLFRRTRSTPQQQGLTKQERQRNLRDAFVLRYISPPSHVAIVDDVVTTGSTVTHLCQLLLEAGVKTIDIYCVCRTPEPRE